MTKRGLTLIEVLLAATLCLMLLGVVTQTLPALLRYASWGSARAELVQVAALTSRCLAGDLQRAPLEGLTLPDPSEPGLLAIHGVVGVTDRGLAVWDPRLIVYQWDPAQRSLKRKFWPPPAGIGPTITSASPVRLSPITLRSIANLANGTETTLARGILTGFSLTPGSSANSLPLRLTMDFELAVPGRDPLRFQHVQDLYLRNGGS